MIARYSCTTIAALGVTFGLFFVMHYLIATDLRGEMKSIRSAPIDLARPARESEVETKRRLPRQTPLEQPPPPPPLQAAKATRPQVDLASVPVSFSPDVSLAGAIGLGAAPSDSDVAPIVRVLPQYPIQAAERGIEGWVLLEFTITKTGRVQDVTVVDADPPRMFDRAAIRSVKRWKYKPKIEDGRPVERRGVQTVISFELTDD